MYIDIYLINISIDCTKYFLVKKLLKFHSYYTNNHRNLCIFLKNKCTKERKNSIERNKIQRILLTTSIKFRCTTTLIGIGWKN